MTTKEIPVLFLQYRKTGEVKKKKGEVAEGGRGAGMGTEDDPQTIFPCLHFSSIK